MKGNTIDLEQYHRDYRYMDSHLDTIADIINISFFDWANYADVLEVASSNLPFSK